jgi:glutamine amidotransferase
MDLPGTEEAVSAPTVVVLDHGSGNVRSAVRALEAAGAQVTLTADRETALAADGLVVPGVGAFSATVEGIRAVGGDRIIERRLAGGMPVLGICVGLQVLFAAGTEHGVRTAGLDQWPGEVTKLKAPVVPHMGWNTVKAPEGTRLFAGIEDQRFYFVHSYAARDWVMEPTPPVPPPLVTWAEHGGDRFVAAVETGRRLLENWLDTLPRRGPSLRADGAIDTAAAPDPAPEVPPSPDLNPASATPPRQEPHA